MWCFVSLFLVVSTSAIDYLERLVSKVTYYVSSGTVRPTLASLGIQCLVIFPNMALSLSDITAHVGNFCHAGILEETSHAADSSSRHGVSGTAG